MTIPDQTSPLDRCLGEVQACVAPAHDDEDESCDHPPGAWRSCPRCLDVVGDLRYHERN